MEEGNPRNIILTLDPKGPFASTQEVNPSVFKGFSVFVDVHGEVADVGLAAPNFGHCSAFQDHGTPVIEEFFQGCDLVRWRSGVRKRGRDR